MYEKQWRAYRWLRNTVAVLFSTYFLSWGAYVALGGDVRRDRTAGFASVCWLLFAILAAILLSYWRCPRCRKPFHRTSMLNYEFFPRKCLHCGLEKFSH